MARILVTKLGLDGHDVGAKVLAVAARDAGHEVVYLGIRQTAATVAQVAVDEDVDMVAVSLLSGAHAVLMPALVDRLRSKDCHAIVVVGGLIPEKDVADLLSGGVAAVVPPGVSGKEAAQQMTLILRQNQDSST